MNIDTRRPVLVMLGAWNPAVFNPQWVATHLYNVKDNTEFTIRIVQNIPPDNKTIHYMENDTGYYVDAGRFEIYANSFTHEMLTEVGRIAGTLIEKLPHTPFGDFGINFRFHETDAPTSLLDKLTSNDRVESLFRVLVQEFVTRSLYSEKCQLNFKRITANASVVFDFNYHHVVQSLNDFALISGEYISSLLENSKMVLNALYDVEGCEEVQHDFTHDNIGEMQQ